MMQIMIMIGIEMLLITLFCVCLVGVICVGREMVDEYAYWKLAQRFVRKRKLELMRREYKAPK